jgi:hypothetical protein
LIKETAGKTGCCPGIPNSALMIASRVTITLYGALFLSYFLPLDAQTAASLNSLVAETGQEVIPLLSWPDKKPLVK